MTSNVIKLPDSIIDPPLLIAMDIQREYTTEGRPYFINGVEPSVKTVAVCSITRGLSAGP